VAQKVATTKLSNIILNRIKTCQHEIRLLRQIKLWSATILSAGINYSVHDLLCDVNNYAWPKKYQYVSHTVNDVSAPSGISRLGKLW